MLWSGRVGPPRGEPAPHGRCGQKVAGGTIGWVPMAQTCIAGSDGPNRVTTGVPISRDRKIGHPERRRHPGQGGASQVEHAPAAVGAAGASHAHHEEAAAGELRHQIVKAVRHFLMV